MAVHRDLKLQRVAFDFVLHGTLINRNGRVVFGLKFSNNGRKCRAAGSHLAADFFGISKCDLAGGHARGIGTRQIQGKLFAERADWSATAKSETPAAVGAVALIRQVENDRLTI